MEITKAAQVYLLERWRPRGSDMSETSVVSLFCAKFHIIFAVYLGFSQCHGWHDIHISSKLLNLDYISLLGNIQYAGQMTSGVAQPQSPSTAKTEMNPGVLVQNSTAGHVQVVDSSHVVTSAGDANHSNNNTNRSRGRGGRGRGKSSGRGRRSTSGPGPEIDHNIEVYTFTTKNYQLVQV